MYRDREICMQEIHITDVGFTIQNIWCIVRQISWIKYNLVLSFSPSYTYTVVVSYKSLVKICQF